MTNADTPDTRKLAQLQALRQHKAALKDRLMAKMHAERVWEARRKEKLLRGDTPHIVFVCHRPSLWGSLKTVFESLLADERCRVSIVAIPNKKQLPDLGLSHQVYIDEGAYEFFTQYICPVFRGYDEHTGQWKDVRGLEPDYVFFQTPYNDCRPPAYASDAVARYARLGYVHYGFLIFGGGVAANSYPQDFLKDLSFIFCETEWHRAHLATRQEPVPEFDRARLPLTGYPRFDTLAHAGPVESPAWNAPRAPGRFRVLWTPRWSIGEKNSHFLEYKDRFLELCDTDPSLDMVCRPHPQTFLSFIAAGKMTEADVEAYTQAHAARDNASLDLRGEYQDTFLSSDVLVSDISSILPEYLLTGKPIIYCHRTDWFNELGEQLAEGFYWARSWDEVTALLRQLRDGNDPLRDVRQTVTRSLLYVPETGAGKAVSERLLKHFYEGVMP